MSSKSKPSPRYPPNLNTGPDFLQNQTMAPISSKPELWPRFPPKGGKSVEGGEVAVHVGTRNGCVRACGQERGAQEGLTPIPSPSTLALNPHPQLSPSTLTLTLNSHPQPSPSTLTLNSQPSPSTLTLNPHPQAKLAEAEKTVSEMSELLAQKTAQLNQVPLRFSQLRAPRFSQLCAAPSSTLELSTPSPIQPRSPTPLNRFDRVALHPSTRCPSTV